nr:carbohydrate kinase family protein [candidate division Zixibacteria bacterium]
MKIGVIGTINRDSIRLADGISREGWGGILYNLAALSNLLKNRAEIIPACLVGRDCYRRVMNIFKKYPGVETNRIKRVPEKNNHCFLSYTDPENKTEILKGGVPPLKFSDLEPLLECDLVLVNYISGRDVHIRSLKKFRRHFKGPIYIDIHSLTLGRKRDGTRYLRRPASWINVMQCGDYIQMNRRELITLAGDNNLESNGPESDVQIQRLLSCFRKEMSTARRPVIIITDGANGCYISSGTGLRMPVKHIKTKRIIYGGNTTGCGDCFSAGFIAGLVTGKNLARAARMGHRTAAQRISNSENIYTCLKSR